MIVISDSVVLSEDTDPRNPRIGWRNVVTAENCYADQEDAAHPVEMLADPSTYRYWQGTDTSLQAVGVQLDAGDTVNYVGLARHNFGSTGAQYVVQSSSNGTDWASLTSAVIPPDDAPILHEFADEFASWFRLLITPGSEAPEIGIWYVGEVLRLPRRIYVGHTPFPLGRKSSVSSGFSENGQFLGRVISQRMHANSVQLSNISPFWCRDELDPFFDAAATQPYFFAWRPATYPNETGFAWMTADGEITNQRPNGMVSASWSQQGIR